MSPVVSLVDKAAFDEIDDRIDNLGKKINKPFVAEQGRDSRSKVNSQSTDLATLAKELTTIVKQFKL